MKEPAGWKFIDDQGTFVLEDPQSSSYLYFPLANQAGMVSSITPTLNGDTKIGQNNFLLLPVSLEDLHNNRSSRNFWLNVNGRAWSVASNIMLNSNGSWSQASGKVILEAGLLWHSITRVHPELKLSAKVTNFVPASDDTVELMRVTVTNQGVEALELSPIAAIPIFGRSADNLRDHRHVTSLLHRTTCMAYGVLVHPTMSFDERGHRKNHTIYAVLGVDDSGRPPLRISPLLADFIGEGGTLETPAGVIGRTSDLQKPGSTMDGYEAIGGLHFPKVSIPRGGSKSYILILAVYSEGQDPAKLIERYGSGVAFENHLEETRQFWQRKVSIPRFDHKDPRLDGWLKWVTLQPVLRRIMGNSFLPYHDYGRGGRGWRDLWQDLLALLLTEGTEVDDQIINNFAGVRMDGSNATIVGKTPGEFVADRNSIPRVWMDHGAWPLITTKLYIDLTGDLDLLLKTQTYFKDFLSHRCQKVDADWDPNSGTILRDKSDNPVSGTVLEHLLVQHLTAFFNVGDHNLIRLEGGDWNDGLDMAAANGESVAFSALYAGNLRVLSDYCRSLNDNGNQDVLLNVEVLQLLDRISGPIDYRSIEAKRKILQAYFESTAGKVSGHKRPVSLMGLSEDLKRKAEWISGIIRQQEWVSNPHGGWFNGYYDNNGTKVEGVTADGVRMTLTGQVFPLMAGIADQEQTDAIIRSADMYLYDENLHGYRLNTDFGENPPQLGRAFSFAYGHKENGAAFNHMAVMFAYACYVQGKAHAAWQILDGIYNQAQNFVQSRIYPGIPEYFNPPGRGMYTYLTGSAAWYLFTLLTESYGIKGDKGELVFEPKLVSEQFANSEELHAHVVFAGKELEIIYRNPKKLSYGSYCIKEVNCNGIRRDVSTGGHILRIPRYEIAAWNDPTQIIIDLNKV